MTVVPDLVSVYVKIAPLQKWNVRVTAAPSVTSTKEPMTLFELQEWLGHRTPEATAHYAKITPNTLARAYNDAGYFARNVRTVEVLVYRDASGGRCERRTLAVLQPRPWLVHLHLLRAVPAPHGLRTLRLLHSEGVQQGPAPGGEGEPAEDARGPSL